MSEENKSKKSELEFRVQEALVDARCLAIRYFFGYGAIIIVFVLSLVLLSNLDLVRNFFHELWTADFKFSFESKVDEKVVLSKTISVPFEAFLLVAIFIWRFSPAAFLKDKSKSDFKGGSSK
jgi:hypothetical protein